MSLLSRGNDALNINPALGVDEVLSVHGSDWLFAVTAIYIFSFVCQLLPLTCSIRFAMSSYNTDSPSCLVGPHSGLLYRP
jgi:bacteriorhodopsin